MPYNYHSISTTLAIPKCSSILGSKHKWTSIWSIRKQKWFNGPTLPIRGCVVSACGVALNQTNAMVMFGQPLQVEFYWDEYSSHPGCIHSIQFSFENLSWHSKNDCLIDIGDRNFVPFNNLEDDNYYPSILNLQCQSVLEKDSSM